MGRQSGFEVAIPSMSMLHLDKPAVRKRQYIRIDSRPIDIWVVVSAGAWRLIIARLTVNLFGEQKLVDP